MTNEECASRIYKKYCETTGATIGDDRWKRQPACRCVNCTVFFSVAREISYARALENYQK